LNKEKEIDFEEENRFVSYYEYYIKIKKKNEIEYGK
jgi:hypothetical protein